MLTTQFERSNTIGNFISPELQDLCKWKADDDMCQKLPGVINGRFANADVSFRKNALSVPLFDNEPTIPACKNKNSKNPSHSPTVFRFWNLLNANHLFCPAFGCNYKEVIALKTVLLD